MRIIRPITIDSANLTLDSSNVPETPPAAYNGGTTYADGDLVSVLQADGFTYKVYESLQGSNTGNAVTDTDWWLFLAETYAEYNAGTTYDVDDIVISTTDHHAYQALTDGESGNSLSYTAKWLDLGANNRYAMFDNSNSTQTLNGASIVVEVTVDGRADAVSLLNMVAASVQIVMETAADGEIYNETFNLVSDSGVNNWYEYFFEPIIRRGDLTVYDLPSNANPTFTITINEPGDIAKVGAMVVGQSRDLGYLLYGARTGIQDYSRKEADEFGNFTIVQRAFAKRATFKVLVDNTRIDALSALLASYRAEAVVWVGVDDYTSTWIYGFYKDFAFEIAFQDKSYLTLELEGLT
jgi:hypothetical protein